MKVECNGYNKMASVNIPLSEFSELCRLCGSKTSVLMGLHIFEREGDLRQIYKKITACLPIQVHNTDKLPKMVCEECLYNLDALFEFRERSMKTEYELNSMLKDLYTPVCNETIPIQMETLICETATADSLQVQNTVEVNVPLEGSSQQLQDIVTITIKESSNSNVKCEPEIIMDVETQQQQQQHHLQQQHNKSHFAQEAEPDSEIDSENDPLGAEIEQSEACSLGDALDANLQVQHIRTLQSIDDGMKGSDDVTTNGTFLVHAQPDQPWFFCDICGKPFVNSDEFQAHCEIHWKKCTICGISCTNDEALIEHVREVHSPPLEMMPTPAPPTPQDTIPPISGSPPMVHTEEEMEDQLQNSDGKRDGKSGEMKACNECGKEYRTNYKLAEHMRKHTGEKPFKCSMCEKAFRSKIGLAQHEAKHTGQFDYTCSTCGKGFQCKSYLIVHQRVHSDLKPYPCDTCGRNFKSKQSLLDHQNRHLGVKPYLCETCGRGFITKGLCKSHQKVHSGTDNRQYPCTVCNKLFVSKSYLATHLRIHTGEKPFMCEVCGKGFLTRVDLRIHSTMHTGEKSFVCEICGKAFARRDALRCHKRSHTGERPYRCDICGQGFTQFSPMAIHKRLHTGERPYTCDICAKTFVSRSTMMSHRKKHVS